MSEGRGETRHNKNEVTDRRWVWSKQSTRLASEIIITALSDRLEKSPSYFLLNAQNLGGWTRKERDSLYLQYPHAYLFQKGLGGRHLSHYGQYLRTSLSGS